MYINDKQVNKIKEEIINKKKEVRKKKKK